MKYPVWSLLFCFCLAISLSTSVYADNVTNTTNTTVTTAAAPAAPVYTAPAAAAANPTATGAIAPMGLSSFDKFLNFIIPCLLVVVFLAFIYSKFQVPLTDFYLWIIGMLGAAGSSINQTSANSVKYTKEIIYEP